MNWIEQSFGYDPKAKPLYILVSNDEYVAFISKEGNGFKSVVPSFKSTPDYHYTHDTLQDAKDWCIAELWKRRLDQ